MTFTFDSPMIPCSKICSPSRKNSFKYAVQRSNNNSIYNLIMEAESLQKLVASKKMDSARVDLLCSSSLASMYSVQRLSCTYDTCGDRKNKE